MVTSPRIVIRGDDVALAISVDICDRNSVRVNVSRPRSCPTAHGAIIVNASCEGAVSVVHVDGYVVTRVAAIGADDFRLSVAG